MSLRLRQAIPGCPSRESKQNVSVLELEDKAYILYTSASNVVVLDEALDLADTLSFWTALPYRAASSSTQLVRGVIGTSDGLIIAWSDVHVVLWQRNTTKGRLTWAVHSILVASAAITCIDFRAGTLVLGTRNGVELWRTDLAADLIVWDRSWERSYPSPASICISPSSAHVAWYADGSRAVHILTLNTHTEAHGMPQELRHPRDISWIGWRKPRNASSDSHLYTITYNSVFRIYSPVLDDPSWFQLLSSLDGRAFAGPSSKPKGKGKAPMSANGVIWALNADVLRKGIEDELDRAMGPGTRVPPETRKILEALQSEEADVLVWFGDDGAVALRSIVNMDRKPPTLLKSLPLARVDLPPGNRPPWSMRAHLLDSPDSSTLLSILPPSNDQPQTCVFRFLISQLLSGDAAGLSPLVKLANSETLELQLTKSIKHFVRTPNGRGLLSVGASGEMGAFFKEKIGKVAKGRKSPKALLGKGHWIAAEDAEDCAIFAKGRAMVSYSTVGGSARVTLQHLDSSSTTPTEPIPLPSFEPEADDPIDMLLAVSDIDDGYSGRKSRTQRAVVMAASKRGHAWVWQVQAQMDSTFSRISPSTNDTPDIRLISKYRFPIVGSDKGAPHLILPVDPMGWHQSVIDWHTDTPLQDMVLTVTEMGVLEFWRPWIGQHLAEDEPGGLTGHAEGQPKGRHETQAWTRTGAVHTGKSGISAARCSSRKKTVLVCENPGGLHELTIWDSVVSEFSTGLEHSWTYGEGELVQDLDWTTTSDLQSVLAVGFTNRVVLVCEQRMSYVAVTPGWAPFITIDMERYTSVPINDSIWLAGGSLAVGCGNQIYLFSRFLDRDTPVPSPAASAKSVVLDPDEPEDLFQVIAHHNGPLLDYHPTVLAQCLLWDKVDLVKSTLAALAKGLRECEEHGRRRLLLPRRNPSAFYSVPKDRRRSKVASRRYDSLFSAAANGTDDEEDEFSAKLVDDLVDRLEGPVLVPLSHAEKSLLATLAQAAYEAEQQRRALDICGMRYLVSIRMFVNQNRLAGPSGAATPASGLTMPGGGQGHRSRLSFRNIVWATHSESQEVLLSAATESCRDGKMLWADAKRLGVFLWLRSSEAVKSQMEVLARNRFMADEDRDPTSCSLIFFALGKKKVVHGLWRQAPGHPEQQLMLKFLANDFDQPRWKTAAMKNAYALLSKQRYEYAAAFFMLAGSAKDAINVCLRQLDDWQLAIALARAVEGRTDGPLLRWVLSDTVVPMAFAGGHRWLATWAFWMLGRRDLAVRLLISPMIDVATAWSPDDAIQVGLSENDDPSLLLLFQHLKSRSLQTAKGASEIPTKMEFDFVLHNARVFCRMGCHSLALDLVRSWSFERPFFPPPKTKVRGPSPMPSPISAISAKSTATATATGTPSPSRPSFLGSMSMSGSYPRARRPSFMLASQGRRESMVMDMDVLAESEAPTRAPSPGLREGRGLGQVEGERGAEEREAGAVKEANGTSEALAQSPSSTLNGSAVAVGGKEAAVVESEPAAEPPRKMGNLMKELKQDVRQGAMEFSMDSFDF